jgi:hypothetical protein
MIYWLRTLFDRLAGLLKPPPAKADRSRLMGMYLDHANQPTGPGTRGASARERQDGKFAQNRRRP